MEYSLKRGPTQIQARLPSGKHSVPRMHVCPNVSGGWDAVCIPDAVWIWIWSSLDLDLEAVASP